VKRFIEVSTALVYASNSKTPVTESGDIDPWTVQARYKREAEQEVLAVAARGLDVVIFRPAFIYGSGDTHMMMTRAACAAAYVELREKMCLLWDAKLRINTVHVEDVVRALWHGVDLAVVPAGSIWNLCDKGDTDQGKVST
jgi:nucleoside-diphosphate-sugar epimerase